LGTFQFKVIQRATSNALQASIRKAPCIDIILGENDHHRSTADLTIVIHLRRHFVRMWHRNFEHFETSGTGDFG
jgi:hypothetical protein